MKFTGEFFIPPDGENENAENPELEIEHRQRYLSILDLVEGRTVLDIACGEGYGTHVLSSRAREVIGVDINPELVAHAGRKYRRENIRFLEGSVDRIPLPPGSTDIVVSFETLEHVSAETQQQFLLEVKRVLRQDGVFIVSTPNKENYTDRYGYQNKFHVREWYKDDLDQFLKKHFGHVILYEQGQEVSSLIMRKEDYLLQKPVATIPVTNNYHFEGKYLIALCSDLPAAVQPVLASIVPESEKSYFQLIDRILSLQQEVETLGKWGTQSAGELDASNARIRQLEEQEKQYGKDLENLAYELQKLSSERDATAKKLELAVEDLEKAAQELQTVSLERDATAKNLELAVEDLAGSNHDRFLKEAELTIIRQITKDKPSYSFGLERLTEEIARLVEAMARPNMGAERDRSAETQEPPGAAYPASSDLPEQIIKLQEELQWYKRTYEARSLLGVLKEKITAKFHK